jgi:hypothetical protein
LRADFRPDVRANESALNHHDAVRAENPTFAALRCATGASVAGGSVTELTQLLREVQQGEAGARDALFAAAYSEACSSWPARVCARAAAARCSTRAARSTSPTCAACRAARCAPEDRRAFFAYASQVMRSVIVSAARERAEARRRLRPVTLSEQISDQVPDSEQDILRVHESLESLEQVDARLARRWCRCATSAATANRKSPILLDVTERTVQRLWLKARLMLQAAME